MKRNVIDCIMLAIIIVGAVNWGLIGLFRFDLIAFFFGTMSWVSRVIYVLVGIAGIYMLSMFARMHDIDDNDSQKRQAS
ncbi:MAG: DUF378 domain-containing protein [Eubacterium sp.]|nr:DUF378 domain-containing protein [Eubacterium sp.]